MPLAKFVALAEDIGPVPIGFVQFQIDKEGKLNLLHLSVEDGQNLFVQAPIEPFYGQ